MGKLCLQISLLKSLQTSYFSADEDDCKYLNGYKALFDVLLKQREWCSDAITNNWTIILVIRTRE